MDPVILLSTIVISYLLGSISFARLISRLIAPDVDITNVTMDVANSDEKMKMQAIGANTASMKLGPRVGCTIGLLDILKGFLPTLAMRLLYPEQPYFLVTAVFTMVGHNWPIYHRFKGGRGISTYYGGFFAIDWLGALVTSSLGMVLGMALLKDMLVAYLAGLWLVIPWMWFTQTDRTYLIYAIAVNIIFMLAMLPDIRDVIHHRRQHGKEDMKFAMSQFPMGRSMLRIMERLRLKKS
jgi:glycerol-3-phosphate acyltransferase PlsY